jgi:hypothetical protein
MPSRAWLALAVLAAYEGLGWLFAWATRTQGLLSPGGAPHLGVVALGLVYLVVRVAVRFGLPFGVAWSVASYVSTRRRRSPARAS